MIFVTVGTQEFSFDRLVSKIDEIAKNGEIKQDICIQYGKSNYIPSYCKLAKPFFSADEMGKLIDECDLVVTHGGVGTIISSLEKGKKVLVVPRLSKYHEHVDDNQLEIAEAFEKRELLSVCTDMSYLAEMMQYALNHTYRKYEAQKGTLDASIINYIETGTIGENG